MKIYNATPHSISIILKSDCEFMESTRKFTAFEPTPIVIIPSSGMKSIVFDTVQKESIDGNVIPLFEKKIIDMEELPDGYDIYIVVSALYASAYKTKGDDKAIFTVTDPVYTPDCKTIIGCLGLMKGI